jgi:hypothetical protein
MTQYTKPAQFPDPYVPVGERPFLGDSFGNLMKGVQQSGPQMPVTGGGGGGTPVEGLDLDVRDGVTGAVLYNGTETLNVPSFGNAVYWVKFSVNNNGAAGFVYFLGSLAF